MVKLYRYCAAALFCAAPLCAQNQVTTNSINLVFFGDSLTEGVPHFTGEQVTYPFLVSSRIIGSTYVKLGYRGRTTDYLLAHLDSFLVGLLKTDYLQNVLVLWGGTNDCAMEETECAQPVFANLTAIAKIAHAAGWKVVVVTMIARGSYFASPALQTAFPSNRAQLNALIKQSSDFDAIADPSGTLCDPSSAYYWDGTHLWPSGYRVVADAVLAAIQSLP